MFASRLVAIAALGIFMQVASLAGAQMPRDWSKQVYTNWSGGSRFEFRVGGRIRDGEDRRDRDRDWDRDHREKDRGDRHADRDARHRPEHRERDDRSESREGTRLSSTLLIEGVRVIATVRIWNDCGQLRTQVELKPCGCEHLPEIDAISMQVTGCRTWRPDFRRVESECREDRIVFTSCEGPKWQGGEANIELKVFGECGSDVAKWRCVEIGH